MALARPRGRALFRIILDWTKPLRGSLVNCGCRAQCWLDLIAESEPAASDGRDKQRRGLPATDDAVSADWQVASALQ
jgi:hypothetical protein